MEMQFFTTSGVLAVVVACAFAFQAPPASISPIADAFQIGWMLADTNGDGIADFINGKVVVPAKPSAAENAAAANLAARLGYGSTGLTPPLVVASPAAGDGPRIFVGTDKAPAVKLEKAEGGVFLVGGNLAVVGADDDGLMAAAEAYSARAPYQWRVPGEKISAITDVVHAELIGVTYLRGKQGIHRAILRGDGISAETLNSALASPRLAFVHELVAGSVSAVSSKPETAVPPAAPPNPPTDT